MKGIAQRAQIVVGFTGTLFTTHLEWSVTQVCSALCLDAELQEESFWRQEDALAAACSKVHGIYHPLDAIISHEISMRPPNPDWRYVTYERRLISVHTERTIVAICDCLDVAEVEAAQFHRSVSEVEKRKCLHAMLDAGTISSKLIALVDAVRALFAEGRYKIMVSVYYLDVFLVVQEYLAWRFRFDRSVKIFEFSGNFNQSMKASTLTSFLKCSSRRDSKSILVATNSSAKNGLNLTNGIDSPTAHVEFEQPPSAADRYQLQCRIDRDGNPHSVQLVILTGRETVNELILERHMQQSQKRKKVGDEVPQEFLGMHKHESWDANRHQRWMLMLQVEALCFGYKLMCVVFSSMKVKMGHYCCLFNSRPPLPLLLATRFPPS